MSWCCHSCGSEEVSGGSFVEYGDDPGIFCLLCLKCIEEGRNKDKIMRETR